MLHLCRNLCRNVNRSSSNLVSSCAEGILTLTMSNKSSLNALSLELLKEFNSAFDNLESSVRAVIINSSSRVFSAGHDLKELQEESGNELHREIFSQCQDFMLKIHTCQVPVIAEVAGPAVAAGCQLVAACDICVASKNAYFSVPGVKIGLFCTTPAVTVGRSLPKKIAMHMLCTGDPISAQEAYVHGLVTKVVEPGDLSNTTLQIAQSIAAKNPDVIALGKRTFYEQISKPLESAYSHATDAMLRNVSHDACQSGIKGFFKKS